MFCSVVYYHVPSEKRGKIDEKAQIGILVGYAAESKGYRVLCLDRMKILMSRDVHIDESSWWDWNSKRIMKNDQLIPTVADPSPSIHNSVNVFDV